MNISPIRFIQRGQLVALDNVAPSRTLLEVLREDLGSTATKEGCAEGDCGACTVVLGQACGDKLNYRAVNSCIQLAHSIDGLALWTAQDIAQDETTLHPAQQAMVECHGSQCGFCTPGFVMSLFAMYQNHCLQNRPITRDMALVGLSGNLCRCTGYRSILTAACSMGDYPATPINEAAVLEQLRQIKPAQAQSVDAAYQLPRSLAELLQAKAMAPNAQLVAGCTDVGLWVTKQHQAFAQVIDVTRVAELLEVETHSDHIKLGASVLLTDAFDALSVQWPQLRVFFNRFAGLPVRNAGTLGGNVANGSPIGDSMPLLIALRSKLVLVSQRGQRELPLEAFYTGYRKNQLAADEVLAWIKIPLPHVHSFLRVYKISKRFDDDISALCLAFSLQSEQGRVVSASIGVGGVAATPVRANQTEKLLTGRQWNRELVQQAKQSLLSEFQPISDLRASAAYRNQVLGNLLERFWLESQGTQDIRLENFSNPGLRA
ncbi:MAG: xanthine dehydrogenase small subunit [Burkholderiaceae bacterium]